MATPISEEELQLKKRARRRLIGAIALVTVVAVFLPMVLDHEPKSVSQDISIQIPSQNAGTFTSKIVPVVPGGDLKAIPAAETPPVAAPAPVTPEPAKAAAPAAKERVAPPKESAQAVPKAAPPAAKTAAAEPKPKAKPDSEAAPAKAPATEGKAKPKAKAVAPTDPEAAPAKEAAPKPKAKTAKAESKDSGSFVVQVAALTDADKAKQMREQIAGAGVKAYTEVVPTAKGSVTRVRAGPFTSRDAAEKARDRLKELGLTGNVVPK